MTLILLLSFRFVLPPVAARAPECAAVARLGRDRELRLHWTAEGGRLASHWDQV